MTDQTIDRWELDLAFEELITGIEDNNKAEALEGLRRLKNIIAKLSVGGVINNYDLEQLEEDIRCQNL